MGCRLCSCAARRVHYINCPVFMHINSLGRPLFMQIEANVEEEKKDDWSCWLPIVRLYRWQRTKFQLGAADFLYTTSSISDRCRRKLVVICISPILHCTGHARQFNFSCVCIYTRAHFSALECTNNVSKYHYFSVIYQMFAHILCGIRVYWGERDAFFLPVVPTVFEWITKQEQKTYFWHLRKTGFQQNFLHRMKSTLKTS
jgi:hypothetical protein